MTRSRRILLLFYLVKSGFFVRDAFTFHIVVFCCFIWHYMLFLLFLLFFYDSGVKISRQSVLSGSLQTLLLSSVSAYVPVLAEEFHP